jgi:hypothetical protein
MQNILSVVRELPSCRTSDRLLSGSPVVLICVPGCFNQSVGGVIAALSSCCLVAETPKQLKQTADRIINCVACQAALLQLTDRTFGPPGTKIDGIKKSGGLESLLVVLRAYPAFTAGLRVVKAANLIQVRALV